MQDQYASSVSDLQNGTDKSGIIHLNMNERDQEVVWEVDFETNNVYELKTPPVLFKQ